MGSITKAYCSGHREINDHSIVFAAAELDGLDAGRFCCFYSRLLWEKNRYNRVGKWEYQVHGTDGKGGNSGPLPVLQGGGSPGGRKSLLDIMRI